MAAFMRRKAALITMPMRPFLPSPPGCSGRRAARRTEPDRGLCGEQQEREGLLQVQPDGCVGVAQVADGYVLADVQAEVAAAGGEHESAGDGRSPDDLAIYQALNVFHHRVAIVAGLAERRIGVGAQQ